MRKLRQARGDPGLTGCPPRPQVEAREIWVGPGLAAGGTNQYTRGGSRWRSRGRAGGAHGLAVPTGSSTFSSLFSTVWRKHTQDRNAQHRRGKILVLLPTRHRLARVISPVFSRGFGCIILVSFHSHAAHPVSAAAVLLPMATAREDTARSTEAAAPHASTPKPGFPRFAGEEMEMQRNGTTSPSRIA